MTMRPDTRAQRSSYLAGARPSRKFSRPEVSISEVIKACILDISDRSSCRGSIAMHRYIFLHQDHDRFGGLFFARVLDYSADSFFRSVSVGPVAASALWDFCCLCYVGLVIVAAP